MKHMFPSDLNTHSAYISLIVQEFKKFSTVDLRSATDKSYNANSIAVLSLPIPKDLQTGADISWNNISQFTSKVVSNAKDKLLGSNAQQLEATTGTTTNKASQVAFESVGIRNHTWSWTLIPRNKKEAQEIENIIYMLEFAKLPDSQLSGTIAKYPYMVKPKLKSNNKMIKFLPCVITSLRVNYTPSSDYMEYEDGFLPGYTISIGLMEITSMNKQIYKTMVGR